MGLSALDRASDDHHLSISPVPFGPALFHKRRVLRQRRKVATEEGFAMTRLTAFSSPFLLGFEQMEEMFDRAARSSGDAYPPYNVERVANNGNAEILRITLAVAGFEQSDLSVEVEASTLTIRGDHLPGEIRINYL